MYEPSNAAGFCLIYDSSSSAKKFEPKHRLIRVRCAMLHAGTASMAVATHGTAFSLNMAFYGQMWVGIM